MALRVSIGQYYSADSPVHRLDPRVKLIVAALFMVSCFFVRDAGTLALAAASVLAAAVAARVPAGRLAAQVRPVLPFLVLTSLFNLLFVRTGTVVATLGPVSIHLGGIAAALLYTLRFALLLVGGGLLMLTTTPTALCDAFEAVFRPLERLGVPVGQGALILSIGLRFVPALAREADDVIAAQTARGADFEGRGPIAYARACVPLIVPLFASALRHANHLGRAMDARCYTGGAGRTHYRPMRFSPRRDLPFCLAFAAYAVTLAALLILL